MKNGPAPKRKLVFLGCYVSFREGIVLIFFKTTLAISSISWDKMEETSVNWTNTNSFSAPSVTIDANTFGPGIRVPLSTLLPRVQEVQHYLHRKRFLGIHFPSGDRSKKTINLSPKQKFNQHPLPNPIAIGKCPQVRVESLQRCYWRWPRIWCNCDHSGCAFSGHPGHFLLAQSFLKVGWWTT